MMGFGKKKVKVLQHPKLKIASSQKSQMKKAHNETSVSVKLLKVFISYYFVRHTSYSS